MTLPTAPSRILVVTAVTLLAMGCGGRVAEDFDAGVGLDVGLADVDPGHDSEVVRPESGFGGVVPDSASPPDVDAAAPWDGSIERCLGKGNFAYAAYTFDGEPGEVTIAGAPWRLDVQLPHMLEFSANPSTDHAAYFDFESPSATEPLSPGLYESAMLPPPRTGRPALRATFIDAGPCSDMNGSFVIHTLEWNGETRPEKRRLKRVSATFETKCYLLTLKGCLNFEQ